MPPPPDRVGHGLVEGAGADGQPRPQRLRHGSIDGEPLVRIAHIGRVPTDRELGIDGDTDEPGQLGERRSVDVARAGRRAVLPGAIHHDQIAGHPHDLVVGAEGRCAEAAGGGPQPESGRGGMAGTGDHMGSDAL